MHENKLCLLVVFESVRNTARKNLKLFERSLYMDIALVDTTERCIVFSPTEDFVNI